MNRTNIAHGFYSLLIMGVVSLIVWLLPPSPLTAGAVGGILWFLSREHAQREIQIANATGRHVTDLKPWEGFTGWGRDRVMDALMPILFCGAAWLAGRMV